MAACSRLFGVECLACGRRDYGSALCLCLKVFSLLLFTEYCCYRSTVGIEGRCSLFGGSELGLGGWERNRDRTTRLGIVWDSDPGSQGLRDDRLWGKWDGEMVMVMVTLVG